MAAPLRKAPAAQARVGCGSPGAFLPRRVFPAAAGSGGAELASREGLAAGGRRAPAQSLCSGSPPGRPRCAGSVSVAGSRRDASRLQRNFLPFCCFSSSFNCETERTKGGSWAEEPPPLQHGETPLPACAGRQLWLSAACDRCGRSQVPFAHRSADTGVALRHRPAPQEQPRVTGRGCCECRVGL